ncbi:hypothetical protein CANARDRAFT_30130 [[Candida] arabinofermentans NRRL YB-2248]|uniref:Uncharacterized protein n=1 Tax=[Candida] arabinofermentans NRRL YB-2248 TaxID=983967 RepID=A0A1E4SUU0_9ASCO|nr:hypothetical protein CANARDRAFT_30130 [[Candida] arabinofermentans NRRL YB-2248]
MNGTLDNPQKGKHAPPLQKILINCPIKVYTEVDDITKGFRPLRTSPIRTFICSILPIIGLKGLQLYLRRELYQ